MSKFVLLLSALVCFGGPIACATAHGRDGDQDGLPDRWERRHGLLTSKNSNAGDPDHDHLSNRREFRLRLNPRRRDTDRDGLRDGAEVKRWKTNPRRADTDGDGIKDGADLGRGRNQRSGSFPTPSTTGVPPGWSPKRTISRDLVVNTPGTVLQDVQFDNADLVVDAPNVIVRRARFRGGGINNLPGNVCGDNLLVEDSTFEPPPGHIEPVKEYPAITWGGYTARRVKLWRLGEGLFVSGKGERCGPVRVEESFLKLVLPDEHCGPGTDDWHTDGIQGYGGNTVIVQNTTIDFREASCGTAPFFYPHSQGNTSAMVDRLLLIGGGYSFRLGMPATVRGLRIANRSWGYGPIDVKCSVVSAWEAKIVTISDNYQVARTVRRQPCNTEAGN